MRNVTLHAKMTPMTVQDGLRLRKLKRLDCCKMIIGVFSETVEMA